MEKTENANFKAEKALLEQYEIEYKDGQTQFEALLKDQQERLTVINALKKRLGLPIENANLPETVSQATTALKNTDLKVEPSSFLGMNLHRAIQACLQKGKRPLSPKELVALLKEGGYYTQSTNLIPLVNTALQRMKNKDYGATVVNSNRKWALTEWKGRPQKSSNEDNPKGI